jgi:phosphoenolpyruvate---glycerone phosphotransferase subunit DhaL
MEQHIDIKALVIAAHTAITSHVDELTELDSAIGDGDHGVNMKRGLDAVLAELDTLAALPLNHALGAAGTRLVMTIGGASGPLFATFLMVLGRELDAVKPNDQDTLPKAFALAVDAVAKRGKAHEGEKTLLDVLVPISRALNLKHNCIELARIACEAARATIPVQATKGRASYLGPRSIGHMDPGARSVSLIMDAIAGVIGSRQ